MIDQQRTGAKITLEDLLRLKRAERPPVEFWAEFDRTLHAKQLAAIVEKRPWWRRSSWRQASRWSVPLSAAAALTVSLATLAHPRIARQPVVAPKAIARQESQMPEVVVVKEAKATHIRDVSVPSASIQAARATASAAPALVVVKTKPAAVSSPNRHPLSVTEQIAGLAMNGDTGATTVSHFASAPVSETLALPELAAFSNILPAQPVVGSKNQKAGVIEPLSQVQTTREARRSRLVALLSLPGYTDASDSGANVMRSREHVANHLNQEALYDSISRLGLKGTGVSIQF